MSDAELDQLIVAFASLPVGLKAAHPRTTPDYEHRLSQVLNGMKVGGAAAEIGEGGVAILEMFLGFNGVIIASFS